MGNIKVEIHQMIDQMENDELLEAVHTLLSNQVVYHSTEGVPLTQNRFEKMIDEGEESILNEKVYSHEEVKAHFESKLTK